jgi:predicted Zn-dependent protease
MRSRIDADQAQTRRPRCAVLDTATERGEQCAWKKRRVAFCLDWKGQGLGTLKPSTCLRVYKRAVRIWASASGLDLVVVEKTVNADVVSRLGKIDGPGYVVAWSEVPCGGDRKLKQRYGSSEPTRRMNELLNRFLHEHGHALGLGHGPDGTVMQPYADQRLTVLTAWELLELEARYRLGRV